VQLEWVAEDVAWTIEALATADLDAQLLGLCAVMSGCSSVRPQVAISYLETLPRSFHPASMKVFRHWDRVESQLSASSVAMSAVIHVALLVLSKAHV